MHKSETFPELEGPWQLVGTREGCPKSRSTDVAPDWLGPPLRVWGSSAASEVHEKLKPQPQSQAAGDWSPDLQGETEAWEAAGEGWLLWVRCTLVLQRRPTTLPLWLLSSWG